jgi:hypothetical protein
MHEQRKRNPFVSMFIPGLILGLLVGGFAGAVLTPILERWGEPPAPTRSTRGGHREAVPAEPQDQPAAPEQTPPAPEAPQAPELPDVAPEPE